MCVYGGGGEGVLQIRHPSRPVSDECIKQSFTYYIRDMQ